MSDHKAFSPTRHEIAARVFALAILCALGVSACSRGPSLSAKETSAFNLAPPELKGPWDTAVAAARTNGYTTAYLTLVALRQQPSLDPEQIKAVDELTGIVGARMFKAANDGDPEAVKALKATRDATSRRR